MSENTKNDEQRSRRKQRKKRRGYRAQPLNITSPGNPWWNGLWHRLDWMTLSIMGVCLAAMGLAIYSRVLPIEEPVAGNPEPNVPPVLQPTHIIPPRFKEHRAPAEMENVQLADGFHAHQHQDGTQIADVNFDIDFPLPTTEFQNDAFRTPNDDSLHASSYSFEIAPPEVDALLDRDLKAEFERLDLNRQSAYPDTGYDDPVAALFDHGKYLWQPGTGLAPGVIPGRPSTTSSTGSQPFSVGTAYPHPGNHVPMVVGPMAVPPVPADPTYFDPNHGTFSRPAQSLPATEIRWWDSEILYKSLFSTTRRQVQLSNLVVQALQLAPQIKVFAAQPLIEETRISEAVAAFDWTSFLETRYDDTSDPVSTSLDAGTASRLKNNIWTLRQGVRRLNRVGGQFEIAAHQGHKNSNSDFFIPNNQGNSRLVLSYNQPLLRGRGRAINESQIVLAQIGTSVAANEQLLQTQRYVIDVIQTYWNLYAQRGLLAIARRNHQRSVAIIEKLKIRRDVDADPNMIIRAEAAASARLSSVINATTDVRNAQEQLMSLVVGQGFECDSATELVPTDAPRLGNLFLNLQYEVTTALQFRPEITTVLGDIQAAAVNEQITRNQMLPQLDAFLETYVAGLAGNSNVGQAFQNQFNQGEPGYGVGLVFEQPIGIRAARARNQRAQLQLRQLQTQFQAAVADVTLDVRTAVREVERLRRDLEAKDTALRKAIGELHYLETRYALKADREKTGSLYLADLLGSQDRLFAAEAGYLQASVDLTVAIARLQQANGLLLRPDGCGSF